MNFARIAGATLGIMFLAMPGSAGAVVLAKLKSGTAQLRLCPSVGCPVVAAPMPGSNGVVPILEFNGDFGRVGPWMTRQEALATYTGIDVSRLPERVALWVSRAQVTTGDPAADEAAALAALQSEKTVERPAKPRMPAVPPVPMRAPRSAAGEAVAAATTPVLANAQSAFLPPLPPGALRIASTPPAQRSSLASIVPEPLQEIKDSDTPASASPPAKLTPELMDKRLVALPAKPDADYSLGQIVALRRQALAYLEQGSCNGIKEGGKTLSPGFLYIVCEGDEAWRQFAE